MVNTCCVPSCNSGYKSNKNPDQVALFKFPKDESLKNKWIKAITRKNWTVINSHRVCAKHFSESDFQVSSQDLKIRRCKARATQKLKRLQLKKSAIPHIFAGLPKYLPTATPLTRGSNSLSSARQNKVNQELEKQNNSFLKQDIIGSFESLKTKLHEIMLPSGFIYDAQETSIHFYYIKHSENFSVSPKLLASVVISQDLSINAFLLSAKVPQSTFKNFLSENAVKSVTAVSNILAQLKALAENDSSASLHEALVDIAIYTLQQYSNRNIEKVDESKQSLITFLII